VLAAAQFNYKKPGCFMRTAYISDTLINVHLILHCLHRLKPFLAMLYEQNKTGSF